MALHAYYPEMGEAKPKAQIEATLSHYGKHYFLCTPLELKGRGVELLNTYTDKDVNQYGKHMIGWHKYQVTVKAFERIKAEYAVSYEILLD